MTRRLYHEDPYMTEFEANIEAKDGDWVRLDRSALYPGGGGQDRDAGSLDDIPVLDARIKDGIWYKVPGHTFEIGQRVQGRVDWHRRYALMKAHTAEHMLFSALSRRTEIDLVKISITEGKRSLVVKGEVSWEIIRDAILEVNERIYEGLEVRAEVLSKEDVDEGSTRIKMDRIHGDSVRVISIGEYDQAACAGIHVRNTKEIGLLLVTKLTSARPAGDWDIEFQTGEGAMSTASTYTVDLLMAAERIGSNVQDFMTAFDNREAEHKRFREALRFYGKTLLGQLEHRDINGITCYFGSFIGIERKLIMDKATELSAGRRCVSVLVQEDDGSFMVLSRSSDIDIDCPKLLNDVLREFGGRGGGKDNFATGGTSAKVDGSAIIERALDAIKRYS